MSGPYPEFKREKARFSAYGKNVVLETFSFKSRTSGQQETVDWLSFGADSSPVVVLALTTSREVIVLRHFRYGARDEVLELPGGTELGSSDDEAALEELIAETGCDPGSIDHIRGTRRGVWFDPASSKVSFVPMIALNCVKKSIPKPTEDEFFSVELYPVTK